MIGTVLAHYELQALNGEGPVISYEPRRVPSVRDMESVDLINQGRTNSATSGRSFGATFAGFLASLAQRSR